MAKEVSVALTAKYVVRSEKSGDCTGGKNGGGGGGDISDVDGDGDGDGGRAKTAARTLSQIQANCRQPAQSNRHVKTGTILIQPTRSLSSRRVCCQKVPNLSTLSFAMYYEEKKLSLTAVRQIDRQTVRNRW